MLIWILYGTREEAIPLRKAKCSSPGEKRGGGGGGGRQRERERERERR